MGNVITVPSKHQEPQKLRKQTVDPQTQQQVQENVPHILNDIAFFHSQQFLGTAFGPLNVDKANKVGVPNTFFLYPDEDNLPRAACCGGCTKPEPTHSIGEFRDGLKRFFELRKISGEGDHGNVYDWVYKTFGGAVAHYKRDPKWNANDALIMRRLVARVMEVKADYINAQNRKNSGSSGGLAGALLKVAVNAAVDAAKYGMHSQDWKVIHDLGPAKWDEFFALLGSFNYTPPLKKALGDSVYAKGSEGGAVTGFNNKNAFTGEKQRDKRMKKVQKLILVDGTDLGGWGHFIDEGEMVGEFVWQLMLELFSQFAMELKETDARAQGVRLGEGDATPSRVHAMVFLLEKMFLGRSRLFFGLPGVEGGYDPAQGDNALLDMIMEHPNPEYRRLVVRWLDSFKQQVLSWVTARQAWGMPPHVLSRLNAPLPRLFTVAAGGGAPQAHSIFRSQITLVELLDEIILRFVVREKVQSHAQLEQTVISCVMSGQALNEVASVGQGVAAALQQQAQQPQQQPQAGAVPVVAQGEIAAEGKFDQPAQVFGVQEQQPQVAQVQVQQEQQQQMQQQPTAGELANAANPPAQEQQKMPESKIPDNMYINNCDQSQQAPHAGAAVDQSLHAAPQYAM